MALRKPWRFNGVDVFKVFPATILPDGRKIPLIKGWQEQATDDPEIIKMWGSLFRERLKYWAVPTGPVNNLLVLDVDVKGGGLETIKTLYIPQTLSQRTVSGGIHYFFKYPQNGKHYGNKVKFQPGLDTRGAGGYVMYYGSDGQPIAEAPDWLLDQVAADVTPPVVQGSTVRVAPEIAQGIIQQSLQAIREAPEGESNNVLNVESFKLGQLVASESITRLYAEEALFQAALARGKPAHEAKATINSGLDGGSKKPIVNPFGASAPQINFDMPMPPAPPDRWTPAFFTRQDLLNTSNLRRPQLFQDWSTEDIHITTADGGTGKTTLKLFEAVCFALGERFLGFNPVQTGKTLFITGEDTDKKLGAMIGQILRQMGYLENFPGFAEKVDVVLNSIVVKKDADLCLIVRDRNGFIHPNMDAMRKLLEAIDDIKPKMIVFDPISSFWGSEAQLNDMNKAVTKFMSELAERGICVEMINHMGKSSSANKDMTQFAGRGGSGLPSNSRVSKVLRPIFEEEYAEMTGETLSEKQSAMMCVINKFTDGSPLYNKPFLILRDGYLFSRKNLTPNKEREQEEKLSDVERVFVFIKQERDADRYPSSNVVKAHFALCGNPIGDTRTKRAIEMLMYQGHLGDKIKLVDNPDATMSDKVFVITDLDGKEL